MRKILALLILLTGIGYFDNAQRVESQPAPINLPANTVWGRLAFGTGPAQAIPFGVLFGNLFGGGAPTAHCVLLGEGSNPIGTACPSTAGNVFLDAGASADPASTAISGDATIAAGGALTIAANAVTNAKAAQGVANSFKCNPTSATGNEQDCLGGSLSQIACVPSVTVETTGSAQTYTIPTCNSVLPLYLKFDIVGGGASAPGSGTSPGAATAGNASSVTFNSVTYTANGGSSGTAGNQQPGGAGGTVSGCDENIPGGAGSPSLQASATALGLPGGGTTLAPGGIGGIPTSTTGGAGQTNSGAGGGAAATSGTVATSPAGGGGATCRKTIAVGALTSATYTVGAAATGGTMGTSGGVGGAGAAGRIVITAYWQ